MLPFAPYMTAFAIERLATTRAAGSPRATQAWAATGDTLTGLLATPRATHTEQAAQLQHAISHVVTADGPPPDLRPGDRLVANADYYWVTDVFPLVGGRWVQVFVLQRGDDG